MELSGTDRISTARQILKNCIDYAVVIREEHCWHNIDENIILKICSKYFIRMHSFFLDTFTSRIFILSRT